MRWRRVRDGALPRGALQLPAAPASQAASHLIPPPPTAPHRTQQVVLVSQCKTIADFNGYFAGMQWAAVPYTYEKREDIFAQNDVHGLPQALVLRVSDGSVVLKDCRELVNSKKTLVGIFQ